MELNIIHVDMDAFYAAIEIRDNPQLKGKPVIIGGTSKRGVVSTASYVAREYGVHSAMPMVKAKKLCPKGVCLQPNHQNYKKVSSQLHDIFIKHTDLIEPLALDEAFLDVSDNFQNSVQIGRKIKRQIQSKLELTASIGISYNKFLAKFASDFNKPDGFKIISPQNAKRILATLDVNQLWGVGPKTAAKLKKYNFHKVSDIITANPRFLIDQFGKQGYRIYQLAQGKDNRKVTPPGTPKSIGKETTFSKDISNNEVLIDYLKKLSKKVVNRVKKKEVYGRTVVLKIKYEDFEVISRSKTINSYTDSYYDIYQIANGLLQNEKLEKKVRLIGVTLTNLKNNFYQQLSLF
ncbi:DNA polymerase IV [Selenihalanaerobacter shriftii]|uniref:DNA polymerase IV n=1 Tax=Selenihalanaerobacter shriftii TaxID=142842 RepID=A0A1T4LZD6_9FIRM|nr:DNA polymerase IV [Selenihalanaerobacter shriftii]SJZ60100.1 DNA polymerase-4 [Selenihalanaerobacter shriftii]